MCIVQLKVNFRYIYHRLAYYIKRVYKLSNLRAYFSFFLFLYLWACLFCCHCFQQNLGNPTSAESFFQNIIPQSDASVIVYIQFSKICMSKTFVFLIFLKNVDTKLNYPLGRIYGLYVCCSLHF